MIEYRIDGFRFDLASILGRSEDGTPLSKPPLLERLAFDPILGKVKLIAGSMGCGRTVSGRKFSILEPLVRVERKVQG